ncbi:CCA-adding enzyme [Candidatus Gugararchaeum adminiculabundum]|nr:CCA-adding enzyme [Candidatus Gugararchaeum adminiculabundum]
MLLPHPNTQKVLNSVLKKIKPSKAELAQEKKIVGEIFTRLQKVVPANIEVVLAGSIAKGTNLTGDKDFDVFMLFPNSYSRKDLVDLGLEWAKKAVKPHKWEIGYAEHPYLQADMHGAHLDIVPAYKINSIDERATSVDRTQFHTKYVNGKTNEKMRDDVRLLKRFLKGIGVYGAELRVEGFSGYLCELLILSYGSFIELVQAAAEWREPVLDIEEHHTIDLRKKFDQAALIVIDPVDRERNVAAAVSATSLSKFIFACQQFLKNPSEDLFFPKKKPVNVKKLASNVKMRGTYQFILTFPAPKPKLVEDILWPQLKKSCGIIVRFLECEGFRPLGYFHWSDGKECAIFFEVHDEKLPAVKSVQGPFVHITKDVEKFLEKHADSHSRYIEGCRIMAVKSRKLVTAKDAVEELRKKPEQYGIPKQLVSSFKKLKLLKDRGIFKKQYLQSLDDYYSNRVF